MIKTILKYGLDLASVLMLNIPKYISRLRIENAISRSKMAKAKIVILNILLLGLPYIVSSLKLWLNQF